MMFCLLVLVVTSIVGIPGMCSAASSLEERNMMMMMNPVVELSSRDELVNMAGYGEEKLSKVTISGRVVCHHSCPQLHAPRYQLPNPISGASVAVVCSKSGKSWARGTTDAYGDFLIDLPSHLHAIPNLEKAFILKLLHLPAHSHCRPAFRGKHEAIQLRSIDDAGARAYTANTIALTTKPFCANRVRTRNKKRMTHVY